MWKKKEVKISSILITLGCLVCAGVQAIGSDSQDREFGESSVHIHNDEPFYNKSSLRDYPNSLKTMQSIKYSDINPYPLDSDSSWWNTSWPCRKALTIHHSQVTGVLTNFPVLINTIDVDLRDKAQYDGDDIVFTDYFGEKLFHEIELFNGTTGELVAWVNVPTLNSTVDIVLYMYYGNLDSSNQENPSDVWDPHYVYVQHLNETSGPVYDSTQYQNDGTSYGSMNRSAPGKMDGAYYFDGSDDSVETLNSSSLYNAMKDAFTVEVWTKTNIYGSWRSMVTKDKGGPGKTSEFWFGWAGNNKLDFKFNAGLDRYGNTSITDTNWHYVVGWFNGTYMRVYLDSIPDNAPVNIAKVTPSDGSVNLGTTNYWGGHKYTGTLDEVRISDIARNGSWLTTCYQNQGDPTTFYSIGLEENNDTIPPTISAVIRSSSIPLDTNPSFGWINVSCEVTDNTAVDQVRINISNPDESWNNVTMTINGGDSYYFNSSTAFSAHGQYQYLIWTSDTGGNANETGYYSFLIPPNWDVNMDGVCNIMDVTLLSTKWLQTGTPGWIREDINNDGTVNIADVSILSVCWLQTWS